MVTDFVRSSVGELLHKPASISLSVVVPAYNEASRIGSMLDETIGVLERRLKADPSQTYEVSEMASERTAHV